MYERWLLECVLERCWTTLKCANMVGADPKSVLLDFNQAILKLAIGDKS
jgi:hypothetical protein